MADHTYEYLLVGGGMAAAAACEGIRRHDPTGTIGILTREAIPPYSRPALSKKLWRDPDYQPDQTFMDEASGPGITVITGVEAGALDADAGRVTDTDGVVYTGAKVLLATSGDPASGGIAPSERIIHFRTLDDYRRLRALAEEGRRIVVAGDGFIGLELAAVLADSPAQVLWVFDRLVPGCDRFPPQATQRLRERYLDRGVTCVPRARVAAAIDDGQTVTITLEDGQTLCADALVTGFGLDLDLAWVGEAGLAVDEGIEVDDQLRTAHPRVWAAGDCAAPPCPIFGRRRVEHKDAALTWGRIAGETMAGADARIERIPYFYSFLFDESYEALGKTDMSADVVVDELAGEDGQFVAFYRDDQGMLSGIVLWNLPATERWDPKVDAERLLRDRRPYTEDELRGAIAPPAG